LGSQPKAVSMTRANAMVQQRSRMIVGSLTSPRDFALCGLHAKQNLRWRPCSGAPP
jgi:hypothetical protein